MERREDDPARGDSSEAVRAAGESNAARAEAAIAAVAAGADPAAEALSLSNRFTDDFASRVRAFFGRRKRSAGGAAGSD